MEDISVKLVLGLGLLSSYYVLKVLLDNLLY